MGRRVVLDCMLTSRDAATAFSEVRLVDILRRLRMRDTCAQVTIANLHADRKTQNELTEFLAEFNEFGVEVNVADGLLDVGVVLERFALELAALVTQDVRQLTQHRPVRYARSKSISASSK